MKTKYALFLMLVLPIMLLAANPFSWKVTPNASALLNSRGWRTSQVTNSYYEWDEIIPEMRFNYYYGSNTTALIDSMYIDEWDEDESVWKFAQQKGYTTHTPHGRIAELLSYVDVSGEGDYLPLVKVNFTYNAQNRLTAAVFNFNGIIFDSDEEWIVANGMYYIYGAGTSFYAVNFNEFEDPEFRYTKSEFDFDARGRIIKEYSSHSPDSLNWNSNYSRTSYTYHPQDNHTGADLIEFISTKMFDMIMFDQFFLPGMITEEITESWMDDSWYATDKTTYEYDSLFRVTVQNNFFPAGEVWLQIARELYFYGDNGQMSHSINQDAWSGEYENYERTDYVWESYTSANDDYLNPSPSLSLSVYPSPFSQELHISSQSDVKAAFKVGVYNLRGQLVRSLDSSMGAEIIWDGRDNQGKDSPTGLYLIRAQQKDQTGFRKVLKVK